MAYKVVVDPKVYDDLHDIHQHIAEDNPGAAGKLIDLIERSIGSLSEMPDRVPLRPDLSGRLPRYDRWQLLAFLSHRRRRGAD
ncbi:MAG: type II toxin-antitoxin system RelE/ParE family toxin [Proteobacteria bacterium]|nr:type II toxin-antitoxin system RelE/ParE family toxin [Pseudomonadota bacterium]